MGADSVKPFLGYEGKWAIVLAMTSNPGSLDFQFIEVNQGKILSEYVTEQCVQWGNASEMMLVVGATRAEDIAKIRKIAPDYFFLVPGVGAQGGSLEDVVKYGWNADCGLLVNSSRAIIYASSDENFADQAQLAAKKVQQDMTQTLTNRHF